MDKPRIQHTQPTFGNDPAPTPGESKPKAPPEPDLDAPLPVAKSVGPSGKANQIRAFGDAKRHEESWQRTPNTTGHGAIHVRTFHSKLTDEALKYLDQTINEWLDDHPQYEVKFVNSTVGVLTGKLKEPHLICQVWV